MSSPILVSTVICAARAALATITIHEAHTAGLSRCPCSRMNRHQEVVKRSCEAIDREEYTMRDLDGATILVTGATDGLGKRVARELAGKGATVLLHGRNSERLEAALEHIRKETGSER